MKPHNPQTVSFINDLGVVGKIYGFISSVEHQPSNKVKTSSDIIFKTAKDAIPVIVFEVESRKNPNMTHNVTKIFNEPTKKVQKPWFFLHVVYSGSAGVYKGDFSEYENYKMYYLFENLILEKNKRAFFLKLNECVLNISSGLETDDAWIRYVELEKTIVDPSIRLVLRELTTFAWKLPTELNGLISSMELSMEQARKLRQVRDIMSVSPSEFVDRMIVFLAHATVRNKWSTMELGEKLESLRFNYIRNRDLMYQLNMEHDKNMASTGTCYCFDLRREQYRRQGVIEQEIEKTLKITSPWSSENHTTAVCLNDVNSEKYKLYYQITYIYGIHPRDLKRQELKQEEIIWLLKKNNKWATTDKGLCWSCGKKPIELPMDNYLYCYDCAKAILKQRKKSYKPSN